MDGHTHTGALQRLLPLRHGSQLWSWRRTGSSMVYWRSGYLQGFANEEIIGNYSHRYPNLLIRPACLSMVEKEFAGGSGWIIAPTFYPINSSH